MPDTEVAEVGTLDAAVAQADGGPTDEVPQTTASTDAADITYEPAVIETPDGGATISITKRQAAVLTGLLMLGELVVRNPMLQQYVLHQHELLGVGSIKLIALGTGDHGEDDDTISDAQFHKLAEDGLNDQTNWAHDAIVHPLQDLIFEDSHTF